LSGTVFGKKSHFPRVKIEKNAGQSQSACDLLRSAISLIQEQTEIFFIIIFVFIF